MSQPLIFDSPIGKITAPAVYTNHARALTDEELCAEINRQHAWHSAVNPALIAVACQERDGVAYSRRLRRWVVLPQAARSAADARRKPMTDADDIRAEALRLVNIAREALGEEPLEEFPAGQPHSFARCPVARALHCVRVSITSVEFRLGDAAAIVRQAWGSGEPQALSEVRPLPDALSIFVVRFDDGQYPDLEIQAKAGE